MGQISAKPNKVLFWCLAGRSRRPFGGCNKKIAAKSQRLALRKKAPLKRTGFTSWDGTYVAEGWVKKPCHEAAVPPGYEAHRVFVKGLELRIHASPIVHIEDCLACGKKLSNFGFSDPDPEFKDWGQGEYACTLVVHRQKHKCSGIPCHFPSDPLPGLDEKRHMTVRFRNSLRKHADRTNRETAKQHKINDKTVANVKKDYASEISVKLRTTDRFKWVTFDEKRIYDKLHFVMSEGYTATMIIILKTDNPDDIRKELETFENLAFIEFVSTDGTHKYDPLINDLFKHALHLRDPHHLLDSLHKCREEVRLYEYRLATGEEKDALRGKKDFWEQIDTATFWDDKEQLRLTPLNTPLVFAAHGAHRDFLNRWHSARNPVEAANFFDDWVQRLPSEIRPFYENFIASIEERRDEIFQYWATGVTNSPAEAVMRNIQAELDKGRRYSESGFTDTMTIKEDHKRRSALGIGDDPSPLDPEREAELSVENSLARSAERARRYQNRVPKTGADNEAHPCGQDKPLSPGAVHGKNEQAPSVESSASPKSRMQGGLEPMSTEPPCQTPAQRTRPRCRQTWRTPDSTAQAKVADQGVQATLSGISAEPDQSQPSAATMENQIQPRAALSKVLPPNCPFAYSGVGVSIAGRSVAANVTVENKCTGCDHFDRESGQCIAASA